MTVPLDLLMRCRARRRGLSRRNGSLIYSAAPDTPPDIRNAVRQYRAALLPLLEVDRIRAVVDPRLGADLSVPRGRAPVARR